MSRRPEFYTHDPAVNAMATAKLSTLARGVDAALNDLAWITGFATCSVSLEDARRHCSDVTDLDPPIAELAAAGRWRREETRLVSLYLLDRQAEVAAFKARQAKNGKKGGTARAKNAAQLALDMAPPAPEAPPSTAKHRLAPPSTPNPEQDSGPVPLSEETGPPGRALDPRDPLAILLDRLATSPPRRQPQLA